MRERENLFSDYIDELRRKEKDEKHQKKEQVSRPLDSQILIFMARMKFHTELTSVCVFSPKLCV